MKKIFISLFILALLPIGIGAKTIDWHDNGRIAYTLQKKCSSVVSIAAGMFADDMTELTGKKVKSSGSGNVIVYQLDKSSNKEMKALGSMQVPVMDFITKKDAYWIGVRSGKIVVAGSNGRGAAYGLLHLAELPARIDDKYESLQIPSVEYRGIDMENFDDIDYQQLFKLMLRLRANTLCEGWDEGEAPSHFMRGLRTLAEEYGIVLAAPHGDNGLRLSEHRNNKTIDIVWHDDNYGYIEPERDGEDHGGAIYHLSYSGQPHDYLWLCTTQPGLIVNEMKTAFSNGADKLWIAAIHDPLIASYQLGLFLDLAWDIHSVKTNNVRKHLHDWLANKFGNSVAETLTEPLVQYFRLVGIRKPEFMDFSRQTAHTKHNKSGDGGVKNTEFNAEEFGNELERYLNDFKTVCAQVEGASRLVAGGRHDEFFTTVEYPVFASTLNAVKILQAQESRLISRPVSFHIDSEALESGVRSIKAYRQLQELTNRYNEIVSNGKWRVKMNDKPNGLQVFGEPLLTDKISEEEIKKYDHYDAVDATLSDDNTIVRNAFAYTTASNGAKKIDMLGRSMKAIDLYKGDVLTYNFYTGVLGGVLRLAFIPTHAINGESLQCSVQIDGNSPRTVIVTDGSHGDRWADGVLRGQTIVKLPVSLPEGPHTLTIRALSDHVVLDQWMIDRDDNRQFYIFPVR